MRHRGTAKADSGPRTALAAAAESGLGRIVERARQLAALDERLRRCLPAALQAHCRMGNVAPGKLVYLVDAPTWVTELRRHAHVLLDAAAAAGIQAGALTIKISPAPAPVAAAKPSPSLSQATRDALRKTAQSVADPALRAQLLRLASVAASPDPARSRAASATGRAARQPGTSAGERILQEKADGRK